MSPRKILIFSTAYFPFIGGAEVSIKAITSRLANEFEFDLITARLKKDLRSIEKIGAVTVYRIGIGVPLLDKLFLPYVGAWKALMLNKKNQYVAFWCIMASFASGAAYIANWFQKKVPIILTLQEGDSESWLRYRWFGLIDLSWRLSLARTNVLTVISTYLLNRARRLGYKGQVEIIPNGVDIFWFDKTQTPIPANNRNRFRQIQAAKEDDVILITTSRLVYKNAVDIVIRALSKLPANVHLWVLGNGSQRKELEALTKKLNLSERVHFKGVMSHASPLSDSSVIHYLNASDIFVRPSRSEGMGNSFIEAMAAEVPVIATPVGGIPDFLKDGETGLFCEVNNPKSIAEKVMEYINNPELKSQIVKNAKEMVIKKYDWDLIAKEMKTKVFDPAMAGQVR